LNELENSKRVAFDPFLSRRLNKKLGRRKNRGREALSRKNRIKKLVESFEIRRSYCKDSARQRAPTCR
jgi:hypothetical protein